MIDLPTIVASVRRHWIVALVGLAATIAAASQVPGYVRSEYQVQGSVILLSPAVIPGPQGDEVTVNPWSRFGSSESGAAAALVQVLRSTLDDGLAVDGEDVNDFAISQNPSNGAIIDFTLTASDADLALTAYNQGLDMLIGELERRQSISGAPQDTWLKVDQLTVPVEPTVLPPSTTRAMAAVVALGVVATVAFALVLDALGLPRRRRRAEVAPQPSKELERQDLPAEGSGTPLGSTPSPVEGAREVEPMTERQYQ